MPDAAAAPTPLLRVAKPWGEELVLARGAETVVKTLRIAAGHRLSLQYHQRKHEAVMLLSGEAELTIGASTDQLQSAPMQTGQPIQIGAGVIHRIAAGPAGADILELAERQRLDRPVDGLGDGEHEVEDIVRLADDYGRSCAAGPD